MPKLRMSDYQKQLEGSFRADRARPLLRTSAEVEAEIVAAAKLIATLAVVLARAQAAVETDVDDHRAIALLLKIPNQLRLSRHELSLLRDELSLVKHKEERANEPDRLKGL
jgi:hypothetical protein